MGGALVGRDGVGSIRVGSDSDARDGGGRGADRTDHASFTGRGAAAVVRGGETFALPVKGGSMLEEGILPGDVVVVRKQDTARNGQTVVALVNNEATIKKYYRKDGRIELHPANAAMKPIIVSSEDEFCIRGIVAGVIRHFNES